MQEVTGYCYTIKTGVITFENGVPTGQLPGRLVNGPGFVDKRPQPTGIYDGSISGELQMTK